MKTHLTTVKNYKLLFVPVKGKDILVSSLVGFSEAHEDTANYGMSHLLEHALLQSWAKYPEYTINAELLNRGVGTNASTHSEYVWYHALGGSENLDFMTEYITAIMTSPAITTKVAETEKHAVRQELLGYLQDSTTQMEHTMTESLLPGSATAANYDMKILIKNLKNLTPEVMKAFFKKHYTPSNITFIVFGDKAHRTHVVNAFRKHLKSKSPGGRTVVLTNNCMVAGQTLKLVELPRADMVKSTIWMVFSTPPSLNYKNSLVLFLLGEVLCSNMGSILYEVLRVQKKWVYEISSDAETGSQVDSVTLKFTCDTAKVSAVILTIKNLLKNIEVSDSQWDGIKKIAVRSAKSGCSINESSSNYSHQWAQYGGIENTVKVIGTINKEDILNCIPTVFDFTKVLILHQAPNKLPTKKRDTLMAKLGKP